MPNVEKSTHGKIDQPWQKKTIVTYLRAHEVKAVTTSLALLFCAFLSAQVFIFNRTFTWVEIAPLSDLPWNRELFSALTYVSLGAILYYLFFYKFLSFLFYRLLGDYRAYVQAKRVVWLVLMVFNYFYVAPFVINILNRILSFVYNLVVLLLFVSPTLGGTIVCFLGYLLVRKFLSLKMY